MIALPPFISEIAAAVLAALATLTVMVTVRRRPTLTGIHTAHDVEREIARVTDKVRHPYTYRVRDWLR